MKKIKAHIINTYNRYIIFIRNSIIKKIRKFHISAPIKKELISLISLNFIFVTNKKIKISVFSRYLILLILALFSYLFYLSTPALYDYGSLQKDLTKKLLKEFNLNTALSANITYKILPSPNFEISNVLLNTNTDNKFNNYMEIKKMKIYVSIKNLHNQKKLEIKNIIISEANLHINKSSYDYINNYFDKKISDKKIQLKKSKIFFKESKSKKKDVLTISTIKKSKIIHDKKNNTNRLSIEGSIYNTNYNFSLSRNISKKNITDIQIKFKKLNAEIASIFIEDSNKENNYNGKANINFSGSSIVTNYTIVDKLISFNTEKSQFNNNNINFKGQINLSPFYYNANLDLKNINAIKLIKNLSKLKSLLDEKILLNKNLNGKLIINISNLKGIKFFDKAKINLVIINGKLFLDNSLLISNKIGKVNFIDTTVISINDKKFFKSKILFEIYNQKKFYQKLQIIKESRIKLNNIYFEVEKDLSIDDFVINKLIINKETANTSLEKTKDLTNLIDINEINKLKNWIELKKFLAHKFSEISKIN